MSDFPLISVIIPAYNAEKWLTLSVSSVMGQSYRNWELIIIDDGSRDDTLQIANELAKSNGNIRVIHTENGGVCRARNIGIETASGDYIAFLDADDCLMPDTLKKLYHAIKTNDAEIAIGWKTNIKEDGTDLGCPYQREAAILENMQALEWSMNDHPAMYAVWGKLYKKELLENVRFVEGKRVHEDSFFVFQCCMNLPKVVLLDEVVLQYRISENSASRAAFSEKFFDILYFAERKKELVKEHYPDLIPLAENVIVKANMALLRNLSKTTDEKYRGLEKQCLKRVRQRRCFYKTAISTDRQWFYIIVFRLYHLYKFVLRIRRG